MQKKRLISGIQPSGRLHIGNYFGALKQFVDLQDNYECFVMIVDYHALHTVKNAEELRKNIIDIATDYLAVGLDPKKVTIFQQSQVSEHTELAWIFDTITTMPYLMRAHAFKDAEAKNKDITVGTFNYPILMAADILLYDPEIVPVGQDQKQHIEITRDTAMKFNSTYSEVFKLPEGYIIESVATVPGVDGRKMSKSYNNTIPLFAERDEIEKAVMGIVTDSGGDIPTNVYEIHKLFRSEDDLKSIYSEHKGKYKALKDILVEDIDAFIKPMREKRRELENNPDLVISIINEGSKHAKEIASQKMAQIKEAVGVKLD